MSFRPQIVQPTFSHLLAAISGLKQGKLLGLPTETVYGLAASIDQEIGLRSIFAYKKRPYEDPLIVHVLNLEQALEHWHLTAAAKRTVSLLAKSFWPGPLTLVAQARASISPLITGSGDYVGIRSPTHPVARQLLEIGQFSLAAPSANLFGHVSPTRAKHVADDFFDRELLILDGDDCTIGIESTVVKVDEAGDLHLLRHGVITELQLRQLLRAEPEPARINSKIPGESAKKIEAPGQYLKHYAPNIPASILCTGEKPQLELPYVPLASCACVDFAGRMLEWQQHFQSYCDLSPGGDPLVAAQRLFIELRALEADSTAILLLLPRLDPSQPTEQALYDRIYRACEGRRSYFASGELYLSSPF